MPITKAIKYENKSRVGLKNGSKSNGEKPGEDTSGFDPFYGAEGDNLLIFPRDRITDWWEDETRKKPEGIMTQVAQMPVNEYRKFMGGYLIPYYGLKEDDIMKMPIKELEYLFEQVMRS